MSARIGVPYVPTDHYETYALAAEARGGRSSALRRVFNLADGDPDNPRNYELHRRAIERSVRPDLVPVAMRALEAAYADVAPPRSPAAPYSSPSSSSSSSSSTSSSSSSSSSGLRHALDELEFYRKALKRALRYQLPTDAIMRNIREWEDRVAANGGARVAR